MNKQNFPFDERTQQIQRYGCPHCGEVLDIYVSDIDGCGFKCNNFDCDRFVLFESYKDADKRTPKSEKKIVRREKQRKLKGEIKEAADAIYRLSACIASARSGIKIRQPRMERCRTAYKRVADLKLFQKGKRVVDTAFPFVLAHPITGERIEITSINSKRRVKAMLNALWWVEKDEYNKATKTLAECRAKLRETKELLKKNQKEVIL